VRETTGVDSYEVPGLSEPVEIVQDRFGVPHIYARTQSDAFVAQGFNAARERLFQIDLWRRRGLGRLSEAFGAEYVEQDRATRLFLYRGDMDVEWARYAPDAQEIATRFTAGINVRIAWLEQNPDQLPAEFQILGHRPERWDPADVVRIRSHGLTRNLLSEVSRAQVTAVADLEQDRVRQHLSPEWTTAVPEGFDPSALPEDLLRTFDLATRPVAFDGSSVRSGPPGPDGSNNWVVAGSRTSTGRPLLASDPHRGYSVPSLRYVAHLSAPGMDVIGAGEPALPGLSLGHNGALAFGFTIFPLDQEDLHVYELDDRGRYRYGHGWEEFSVLREEIPVRGERAREVELVFTRHGPVIRTDRQRNLAYAVRTAWLEPGMAPYFGSIAYMRARTSDEFAAALRTWGAPTENQLYADVDGNIGWVAAGLVPKRPNHDGLLPVPGDGRFEWDGFWSAEDLPRRSNPPEGFLATANHMNLPDDYPSERKIGFEWYQPFRHQRIVEVLTADDQHSPEAARALQNDQLSIPARRLTALLRACGEDAPDLREPLRLLGEWDCVESADSAAAALFEVWLSRHLGPDFVRAAAPAAAPLIPAADTTTLLDELESPGRWLPNERSRDRLLLDSLRSARAELAQLLGDDPSRWQWGSLLRTPLLHPVPEIADVGHLPRGGSPDTVNQSEYAHADFVQLTGPSFRVVVDVGNWDASRFVNAPGQSGNPDDPHYADLADAWRDGRYFPLAYSRGAVEELAERRIRLEPAQ
jgi:penicillin amidase